MARLAIVALMVRFLPEEEELLATKFPTLSRHVARSLIKGGLWIDGEAGSLLTVEGTPVDDLIYLARGEASVHLGDSLVGRCGAGSLIGEVTCLSGDPATATVRLETPAHYFAIGAVRLRQLCSRNPDLRHALEAGFGVDVRRKLEDANEARRQMGSDSTEAQ
jgi:CRP-like cAMP-binding protein